MAVKFGNYFMAIWRTLSMKHLLVKNRIDIGGFGCFHLTRDLQGTMIER